MILRLPTLAISALALLSSLAHAMDEDKSPYRATSSHQRDDITSSLPQATSPQPSSPFAERVSNRTLQENTLRENGFNVDESTIQARFMPIPQLAEEIRTNNFGFHLDLSLASFLTEDLTSLFEALQQNTSISQIKFSNCRFKLEHFNAIATMLSHNTSLQELNFMDSAISDEQLSLLALGLKQNKGLSHLDLRVKKPFSLAAIEAFYKEISANKALRLIVWPENRELSPLLQCLAPTNSVASLHLGIMYDKGINVEQDLQEAEKYLSLAANKNHPIAYFELASIFSGDGDVGKSLLYLNQSARDGYAPATYKLALYYRGEWGNTFKANPYHKLIFSWLDEAASQGHVDALYRQGRMYEKGRMDVNGRGISADIDKAIKYFKKATLKGYVKAPGALAYIYSQKAEQLQGSANSAEAKEFQDLSQYYTGLAARLSSSPHMFKLQEQQTKNPDQTT